jgi:excisionase family DNA binding protein
MENMLLKPEQVAEALAIGRTKTYALLAEGRIPSIRIDGSIRVPIESLRRWIAEHTKEGSP